MFSLSPRIAPILMLVASNVFMTYAWYGHLKHRAVALPLTIFISWLIALPEYSLAVPANRIGSFAYTAAADYSGLDSFTYVASDGLTSAAPVTVTLNVNAPAITGGAGGVLDF